MRTFELSDKEEKLISEWNKEHKKTCGLGQNTLAAIGGRLTYSFTPTGIGAIKKVTCMCGGSTMINELDC